MNLSNEELFARGNLEACMLEDRLGRSLTKEEFSEFMYWYISNSKNPANLKTPNPIEAERID